MVVINRLSTFVDKFINYILSININENIII